MSSRSASETLPVVEPANRQTLLQRSLQRGSVHVLLGLLILLIDLFTGPYLQFPILFVLPVALAGWHHHSRLACVLAVLLPLGRLGIACWWDHPSPLPYMIVNFLIRAAVLLFIARLVRRTAEQTRELEQRAQTLVKVCAWSRTVEYEGQWLSFEEYLQRRFHIQTTHGISPAEVEKLLHAPPHPGPAASSVS